MRRWLFIILAVVLSGWFAPTAHALTRAPAPDAQARYDDSPQIRIVVVDVGITMDTYQGVPTDPQSLHKYLYCRADPINRIDPSGRDDLGSLTVSMDIAVDVDEFELPAISMAKVAAIARIAAVAVAAGAILEGDTPQQNVMRLQLQEGTRWHYWSQAITASQNPGVTRNQVQLTLGAMFTALQLQESLDSSWDTFQFSSWEPQLWSAIITMSARLRTAGPVSGYNPTFMQQYLDPTDETAPRIDLENIRGTNLRQ